MDECAVSNAQFATFCKDTGYVTEAERMGVSPVFHLAVEADPADVLHRLDTTPWWVAVRGADWRHPGGRQMAGPTCATTRTATATGWRRGRPTRPGQRPAIPASAAFATCEPGADAACPAEPCPDAPCRAESCPARSAASIMS